MDAFELIFGAIETAFKVMALIIVILVLCIVALVASEFL